ncbi:MAG: hypothetical protein ACSHX9_00775 [Luteolibacter sp.]
MNCSFGFALLCLLANSSVSAAEPLSPLPIEVEVARAPGKSWKDMPVRTLADLPSIPVDPDGGSFGGMPMSIGEGPGFFKTLKAKGRWWLVDPEGRLYIHKAVNSVKTISSVGAKEQLGREFGSVSDWATATCSLLHDKGFNGIGAWCDYKALKPGANKLAYTKLWSFMSKYGKKRGGTYQKPGHTGYPQDCPFIFDPEFPVFCMEYVAALADTKDDPWLIGHFTDNEMPWRIDMLDNYLKLREDDPGYLAASKFLVERHGSDASKKDITEDDREDFLAFAVDTYYSAVCPAIRHHDPNHLILGSRFHGRAVKIPRLFEAAGKHLDVVSVNYYHAWTPDPELLASWSGKSGKPIIITEWYAKGMDSGLGNTSGAGWLVKTQQDRAAFYQNFTLGLLESRVCVGWHWFRYSDNDPTEKGVDPSNLDANKGIVTNRYKPYGVLLEHMREINSRTLGIIRYFDGAE